MSETTITTADPAGFGDVLLAATGVGYTYPDGHPAVCSVDLEVRKGEIVSIIGPSGCGKSTLLQVLAHLRKPTRGTVGQPGKDEGRLPCTMVFQEDTLLPWLKVRDNVALGFRFEGRSRSRSKQEIEAHVDRLLAMVGLSEFGNVYPAKLSGGMKRRVAVLTAIAPLPSILLLDEPFSALDEPTRIGVHRDIYALIREFNMAAVLVTHDLAEAITLSDRILLLSKGPSHIVEAYTVPYDVNRELLDLRADDRFLRLYGSIWHDLELQIKATESEANEFGAEGSAP